MKDLHISNMPDYSYLVNNRLQQDFALKGKPVAAVCKRMHC